MTPLWNSSRSSAFFPSASSFSIFLVAAFNLRVGIQYGLLGIREPGSGRGFLCHSFLFVVCAGVAVDDMALCCPASGKPELMLPSCGAYHLLMLDRVPR